MAKGDLYTGRMRGFQIRPLNCDKALGTKEPCPHCAQFHLRPGYCQACDAQKTAIDAEKDAWIKNRAEELRAFYANIDNDDETLSEEDETLTPKSETLSEDSVSIVPLNYCEVCGEAFEPKRKTAKYCGAACRLKAHRQEDVS